MSTRQGSKNKEKIKLKYREYREIKLKYIERNYRQLLKKNK